MKIPNKVKTELKKPLGKVYQDYREIKKLSKTHKIISIGDICTLALLDLGIRPHLAVFDLKFMRKKLKPAHAAIIKMIFKNPMKMKNKPGTISEVLLKKADSIVENGGALMIDGEEDLTALAFINAAKPEHVLVYGQPKKGLVVVKIDKKIKKKIEKILSLTLSHKVKRNKRS